MLGKVGREPEDLLEDLEESIVAEVNAYSAVYRQVLYPVHIAHLNDQVVKRLQPDQKVLGTHRKQRRKLAYDALQFRVVEPRHLRDLAQQHYDHLENLVICAGAFLSEKVEQVTFDLQFFSCFNFEPGLSQQLLDSTGCEVLSLRVLGLLQKVAQFSYVLWL